MKGFSVIGAGRLGANLISALIGGGYELKAIYRKSKYNRWADCVEDDLAQVVGPADFVIIAVQESKIKEVALQLARETGPAGKVFFHTANALTSSELAPIKERGGFVGSFSPLQTFVDLKEPSDLFTGVYFLAEGDEEALRLAREITGDIGSHLLPVRAEDKIYFHIAAVAGANFLIALLDFAAKQLEKCRPAGDIRIMLPMIREVLKNVEERGIPASLSGPVKRRELSIVKKHLDHLSADEARFYRVLSDFLSTISPL